MRLILLIFLSLHFICNWSYSQSTISDCQKRSTYTWYFGQKAGIKFDDNNTVTPLTDGQSDMVDNTSAISDTLGNLLFYSDGSTVWNKNHAIMQNGTGLLGSYTGGQAVTIVPKPGSNSLYYLITTDAFGGSNGLRYSIVDITQNGGLGNVIQKNILLYTPSTEKVTIARNCNGIDYWIISHKWNTNQFYVYPLTSAGIGAAVVSTIGTIHSGGQNGSYNALGQMKVSPNGKSLALGIYSMGNIELFDFDNSTGELSNYKSIIGYDYVFGLEFSPNGRFLYVSQWSLQRITQFDILAGSSAAITSSATIVGQATGTPPYHAGYMQLGPDEKIYIARWQKDYLATIENPDIASVSCNFVDNGKYLGGKLSYAGLPQFPQGHFTKLSKPKITGTAQVYRNSTATFSLRNTSQGDCKKLTTTWSTLGNATVQSYTDTTINLNFPVIGTDTIIATSVFACNTFIDTFIVNIIPPVGLNTTSIPCSNFYIPNVFTPNSDGLNEYWEIMCSELITDMAIYNRWGQLVYNTNKYTNNWDGGNLSSGIYYYYITFGKDTLHKRGYVYILR